jgi:hypothetical protein
MRAQLAHQFGRGEGRLRKQRTNRKANLDDLVDQGVVSKGMPPKAKSRGKGGEGRS